MEHCPKGSAGTGSGQPATVRLRGRRRVARTSLFRARPCRRTARALGPVGWARAAPKAAVAGRYVASGLGNTALFKPAVDLGPAPIRAPALNEAMLRRGRLGPTIPAPAPGHPADGTGGTLPGVVAWWRSGVVPRLPRPDDLCPCDADQRRVNPPNRIGRCLNPRWPAPRPAKTLGANANHRRAARGQGVAWLRSSQAIGFVG